MGSNMVGLYQLNKVLATTKQAVLYLATKNATDESQDELFYIVKEYIDENLPEGMLEKEKIITQEIENHAKKSIVIPVLEIIKKDGQEYAVMQLKQNGMFLSDMIKVLEEQYGRGKIPKHIQLSIMKEILISLKELHSFSVLGRETGYIHMDIHPGNIFFESVDIEMGRVGTAKLIDFSNALKIDERHRAWKKEEFIVITPGYSAPEQKYFENQEFFPTTDLYSVAAVETRIFTGEILNDDMEDYLELLNKMFDNKICSILEKVMYHFLCCGLEHNKVYRYKSADEMLKMIDRLMELEDADCALDYYTLFTIAYEMLVEKKEICVQDIKYDNEKFYKAVNQLADDLKKDVIHVPKCTYIYHMLYEMEKKNKKYISNDIRNSLLSSGIACCNHNGDKKGVISLFGQLEQCKNTIPVLEYFGILNRVAVAYSDMYCFQDAYLITKRNIEALEQIKSVYSKVARENGLTSKDSIRIKDLARAYSSMGSYMIQLHQGNPMDMFNKALDEFGNDTGNIKITIAHILHYAIEQKDKMLYKKYAVKYFDTFQSIEKCLKDIMDKAELNPYSLYVLLKGIYTFFLDSVNDEMIALLTELIDSKRIQKCNAHPIEMIYKYIALILYKKSNFVDENVGRAFLESITCLKQGKIDMRKELTILMCITYHTMWIYNTVTGQDEENIRILEYMKQHSKKSKWIELYDTLEERNSLDGILEYEYC